MADMQMQLEWCQIIKPVYAHLKFRLPYDIDHYEYLSGTIYLQPYTHISIESRIMTNDYETMVNYNPIEFTNRVSYFNAYYRCSNVDYGKMTNILKKYGIRNTWDNAFAVMITKLYHVKKYPKNKRLIYENQVIG